MAVRDHWPPPLKLRSTSSPDFVFHFFFFVIDVNWTNNADAVSLCLLIYLFTLKKFFLFSYVFPTRKNHIYAEWKMKKENKIKKNGDLKK